MGLTTKSIRGNRPDTGDDDDCLPELPGMTVPTAAGGTDEPLPVEAPAVSVSNDPRIPSLETFPPVATNRAKFAGLADQWRAVKRDIRETAAAAGLNPDDGGDLEEIAAQLMLDGKSTDAIDKLEKLMKAETRLAGALQLAAREIALALELAARALGPQTEESILRPLHQAEARAWVALIAARRDKDAAIHSLYCAKFGCGQYPPLFPAHGYPVDYIGAIGEVRRLVATGALTPEEAATAGF